MNTSQARLRPAPDRALARWAMLAIATLTLLAGCSPEPADDDPAASLLLHSGQVWTGVPDAPLAEAVAIADGTILAVGSDEELERHAADEGGEE